MKIGAVDIYLFLRALPLARRAQEVRSEPLDRVVEGLAPGRRARTSQDVERVALAAARATARWARWSRGLDTCLTRSLVLGAMMCGRGEVCLVIGFRSGEVQDAVAGHAWVTIDGRPAGPDADLAEDTYQRSLEVPFTGRF